MSLKNLNSSKLRYHYKNKDKNSSLEDKINPYQVTSNASDQVEVQQELLRFESADEPLEPLIKIADYIGYAVILLAIAMSLYILIKIIFNFIF